MNFDQCTALAERLRRKGALRVEFTERSMVVEFGGPVRPAVKAIQLNQPAPEQGDLPGLVDRAKKLTPEQFDALMDKIGEGYIP